ncbi:hypothetical protein N9B58_00415 [bacterium]|nr:hypothetical protein [bacterium]
MEIDFRDWLGGAALIDHGDVVLISLRFGSRRIDDEANGESGVGHSGSCDPLDRSKFTEPSAGALGKEAERRLFEEFLALALLEFLEEVLKVAVTRGLVAL